MSTGRSTRPLAWALRRAQVLVSRQHGARRRGRHRARAQLCEHQRALRVSSRSECASGTRRTASGLTTATNATIARQSTAATHSSPARWTPTSDVGERATRGVIPAASRRLASVDGTHTASSEAAAAREVACASRRSDAPDDACNAPSACTEAYEHSGCLPRVFESGLGKPLRGPAQHAPGSARAIAGAQARVWTRSRVDVPS